MECLCVHAAGSHEDRSSADSPVVLSSFVSQLELGVIGRITSLGGVHENFSFTNDTEFFSLQTEVQEITT